MEKSIEINLIELTDVRTNIRKRRASQIPKEPVGTYKEIKLSNGYFRSFVEKPVKNYIVKEDDTILDLCCMVSIEKKMHIQYMMILNDIQYINMNEAKLPNATKLKDLKTLYIYSASNANLKELTKYEIELITKKEIDYITTKYEYKFSPIFINLRIYINCPEIQSYAYVPRQRLEHIYVTIDPLSNFHDLENQMLQKIVDKGIIKNIEQIQYRSIIQLMNFHEGEDDGHWTPENILVNRKDLRHSDYKDMILLNKLISYSTISMTVSAIKDNFIKLKCSYLKNEKTILINQDDSVNDIMKYVDPLIGKDRHIVIYHNTKILNDTIKISTCLIDNDSIKIVVLPRINYTDIDFLELYKKRNILYDLTININDGKSNSIDYNVFHMLFIINSNMDEDNLFFMWLKNKGKFDDIKSNKMIIDVSSSPFDKYTWEENNFTITFIIDYMYHNNEKYDIEELMKKLQCLNEWINYFGLIKLKEFINSHEVLEYYERLSCGSDVAINKEIESL
ncbi:MAG: hypothetical protein Edafosvirus1_32 [Edafosvirus sp.]|uniref:Uncharacterized protein n=1 Tax=Edafosvirus sp. TaxID=2487765 RepID=A0A3G4ZUM9_9VIRU|nr:MAG: hypothetical protein Edafosvirus1_32 [Edafosvirus sp.]